jgi:SAM-dependent methyltransferase
MRMSDENLQPDFIYRTRDALDAPVALLAAMELDLFTPLEEGPLSADQLASRLGVNARKLAPLLYALVPAGYLTVERHEFANSAIASEFLVKDKPRYMGRAHHLWRKNLKAMLKTAETIRTGEPQSRYDWNELPESDLKEILMGMYASTAASARWFADHYDLSGYQKLLDAGGGSGALAITLAEIHPHIQATVVELPRVAALSAEIVREKEASDRVRVAAADIIRDQIPGAYDVAFLKSVIQTLSAEEAGVVIENVGRSVVEGGRLFIVGPGLLDNSRLRPESAVGSNLIFINVYEGGQAYTRDEYEEWLGKAGFGEVTFDFEEFVIAAKK